MRVLESITSILALGLSPIVVGSVDPEVRAVDPGIRGIGTQGGGGYKPGVAGGADGSSLGPLCMAKACKADKKIKMEYFFIRTSIREHNLPVALFA